METVLFALADWAIRATLLAAAAATLLWLLRIQDAHLRLTAWTIVLIAILVIPLASPLLPRLSIALPQFLSRSVSQPPAGGIDIRGTGSVLPAAPPPRSYHPGWTDFGVAAWALVAILMLIRLAVGLRLSALLVRQGRAIQPGVLESDAVRVPITVGIFHPLIILPSGWRAWSESRLFSVLAHEEGHVARRDPLRQFAASVYRSLAWFHPLAWWLRAEINALAEAASDDVAISASQDRVKYAETLLSFIELTPRRVQWEGVSMANPRTRMRRIDRILDQNRKLSAPAGARVIAAMALAALPLVYVICAIRPVAAQTPESVAHSAPDAVAANVCGGSPAYAKWLNEDVAYIITNEERVAITHLHAAPECAMFVEQFWLRRDPTPDTAANEFKEEHYRRIAYASQRFASNHAAGWQTDRGRIYITYGPPDEIESHPHGEAGKPPFEQWLYRHIEALGNNIMFEFSDPNHDLSYRLSFMGDYKADQNGATRPVVFGPVDGVYVQVNRSRTLFITSPVRGASVPVYGRIVDRDGKMMQSFEDSTRAAMYGKWIGTPLPAGQYKLELEVGGNRRSIPFEVK